MNRVLDKKFYSRDTAEVAKGLLGKVLVRKLDDEYLEGIIVETEAYYGVDDPASRAYHGKKQYNRVMFEEPGHLFIYNVHRYWMLNFIAHDDGVGGILIRAIEPTKGIETMQRNRPKKKETDLTSGPGKLTVALRVTKNLNGLPITDESCTIHVKGNEMEFEIGTSHRIGVTKDLPKELRFYIKKNRFVSK
ncbi:MAG: DNA-3-methyladenine glycosylase [Candidatus Bathyarchaeota archaeon]|nr:DNA-3-methyladenine glycosylase [Candidatus Bathyarchaeota archaeon]